MAVRGLGELREPVLLSPAEHPAVAEPAQQRGACWWSLDRTGQANVVPPAQTVGLVCLVHAQSELGTLQPVHAALALARDLGVPCLVDAAQTLGRVRVRPVLDAGAVVALSPHKAGGLRGHGVLLGRDLGRRLRPLLHGGGQELGLRPGTASPALAAANALAIELAECSVDERARSMAVVRQEFVAALQERAVAHELLTPLANSVPNTVMVRFVDVDGRNLLPSLDLAGVQASHGRADAAASVDRDRPRRCDRACVRALQFRLEPVRRRRSSHRRTHRRRRATAAQKNLSATTTTRRCLAATASRVFPFDARRRAMRARRTTCGWTLQSCSRGLATRELVVKKGCVPTRVVAVHRARGSLPRVTRPRPSAGSIAVRFAVRSPSASLVPTTPATSTGAYRS
jgi:hypothetical protein